MELTESNTRNRLNRARNIAIDVMTYDCEHLLVFKFDGRSLLTVGVPGGHEDNIDYFYVWLGAGADLSPELDTKIASFKVMSRSPLAVEQAWHSAVRYAYSEAVNLAISASPHAWRESSGMVPVVNEEK